MNKGNRKPDFSALDLNLLKVFDIIMQERSLTRCAERMGKSVTATSQALRRLRHELGDELFESPGRGMVPTRRALEIAPCIHECISALRMGLTAEPSFDPQTSHRTFIIDIPVGGEIIIGPPLIAYAAKNAPNVTIHISNERAAVLRSELRYGETELGIDFEAVEGEGLHHEKLYSDQFFLMSRRGHPDLTKGAPIPEAVFSKLQFVGLGWGRTKVESPLASRLVRSGVERNFRVRVPTIGAIPAVVECTNMVATLSERVVRNLAKRWKIDIHEIGIPLDAVPIYMVWHVRFDADPGHVWLRFAVKAACDMI